MLRHVVRLNPLVLMSEPDETNRSTVTGPGPRPEPGCAPGLKVSESLTFGHHSVEDPLQLEGTDFTVLQDRDRDVRHRQWT